MPYTRFDNNSEIFLIHLSLLFVLNLFFDISLKGKKLTIQRIINNVLDKATIEVFCAFNLANLHDFKNIFTNSIYDKSYQSRSDYLAEWNEFHSNSNTEIGKLTWYSRQFIFDFSEEAAIVLFELRKRAKLIKQNESFLNYIDHPLVFSLELCLLDNFTNNNSQPSFAISNLDERIQKSILSTIRTGQFNFRQSLIAKFNQCCITNSKVLVTLEAAHIYPFRGQKDNDISNGLLLRSDIHKLFDAHLIAIHPIHHTVKIAPELFNTQYEYLNNKKVYIPNDHVISLVALNYRWEIFNIQKEHE